MLRITSTATDSPEFTVPLHGIGTTDSQGDDSYLQPDKPQVDVLFVVDNSGSMSEEQELIANNFTSFIQTAVTLDSDYHLGVVIPDVESEWTGKFFSCSSNRFITASQPASEQQSQFECNVRTSSSGRPGADNKEASLEAARKALDYPNQDPNTHDDYNDGFLREAAKLYLVIVTDENDQSDGPVDLYIDFFRNLKGEGNADLLNISAITGDPPSGCPVGSSQMTAMENQYDVDAVNATNGMFESICNPDWSGMLANLGLDVFNARSQFQLSRPADSSTIQVTSCPTCTCPAEGDFSCRQCCSGCATVSQDASNGWSFDGSVNAVTFHGTSVPGPSQCVEVEYQAICY
jgi:hypothetical protein